MILDQIDIKILTLFSKLKENEFFSTWGLMRKIFPKGRDSEHMKIKRKIESMAKIGLFTIEGKPKIYTLDSDKVYLKKISFPNRRNLAISLLVDGKWESFEL